MTGTNDTAQNISANPCAQGFALIFWAVSFVPVTLIGVGFAFVEDIDWRGLIKQEKTPSAQVTVSHDDESVQH